MSSSARLSGEIIFHFDVSRGSIPLSQFIETARATQEIIDDFNRSLFDEKLEYELRVKTPEDGSLIAVLAVVVVAAGSVLKFLDTDIGKAFFKGLTGEEPVVWAEQFGSLIREVLLPPESSVPNNEAGLPSPSPATPECELPPTDVAKEIEAESIALMLIGFVETDSDRLKTIGITPEKFRASFLGRNRFFKSCIDNPEVMGVTFDREPNFEIKRSEFPHRITLLPDPPKEEPAKQNDLNFDTVDIVVNSPNWKRDNRFWRADTRNHSDVLFSIEDEGFWLRVEHRDPDLRPTIRDNMRVQWAYPAGATRLSQVKVYRVLSYNGKQLSSPMRDDEIQALQATVHFVESDEPDLFDERRSSKENNDKGGA